MENINLYLGELVGTAFFYGVRTWRLCQYFLKKSGMYGSGGLLAACGWGYQWCPLLLFLDHSPVIM
ncbi:TPA: hypothetical protein ACPOGW_001124 [Haemophilus influenzae]